MKLRIINHGNCVTVQINDGPLPIACADMDLMTDHWWLARLKVYPKHRRKGLGRQLIEALKANCRGKPIQVMPGGYDITKEEQFEFYRRCGFTATDANTMWWYPMLG